MSRSTSIPYDLTALVDEGTEVEKADLPVRSLIDDAVI